MALPYEILIRSTDGKYSGAQVLDTPTSPARAIKAEDWPAIVKGINAEATAATDAAKAEVEDLKKQLEAGAATLAEHQKISDDLANRAEKAMAAGDLAALPEIIADAKTYGNAREKKKLLEEAAEFEKQCAELEAKAAELKKKADSI